MGFICFLKGLFRSKPQSENIVETGANAVLIADKPVSESEFSGTDLVFRLAKKTDLHFIFSLIISEAKNGHFSSQFLYAGAVDGLREQILSTIVNSKMPVNKGKFKVAKLHVLATKTNPIGFMWITKSKYEHINGWELYMCALQPSAREKGLGRLIVKHSLNVINGNKPVFVRLYPKSLVMKNILESLGFHSRKTKASTLLYVSYKRREEID